jgi:acetyl esterase
LRDEGEAYGKRLQEAGVKVTLSRYPGMIHAFIRMSGRLEKAKEAIDEIAGTLRGALRIQFTDPNIVRITEVVDSQ